MLPVFRFALQASLNVIKVLMNKKHVIIREQYEQHLAWVSFTMCWQSHKWAYPMFFYIECSLYIYIKTRKHVGQPTCMSLATWGLTSSWLVHKVGLGNIKPWFMAPPFSKWTWFLLLYNVQSLSLYFLEFICIMKCPKGSALRALSLGWEPKGSDCKSMILKGIHIHNALYD